MWTVLPQMMKPFSQKYPYLLVLVLTINLAGYNDINAEYVLTVFFPKSRCTFVNITILTKHWQDHVHHSQTKFSFGERLTLLANRSLSSKVEHDEGID